MEIRIVVAAAENDVIGLDNELPWQLPDDLKFFKKMTLGMPVIMGRNTWLSLGRALPNRLNIVISSSLQDLPEGVLQFSSLDAAISSLKKDELDCICIIGGGQIYKSAIDITDVVYITRVHTTVENGTAFFPKLQEDTWKLTWEENHAIDEKHAVPFTFQKWERIS